MGAGSALAARRPARRSARPSSTIAEDGDHDRHHRDQHRQGEPDHQPLAPGTIVPELRGRDLDVHRRCLVESLGGLVVDGTGSCGAGVEGMTSILAAGRAAGIGILLHSGDRSTAAANRSFRSTTMGGPGQRKGGPCGPPSSPASSRTGSGEPGVLLDHFGLRPPLAESECLSGPDGGEADQHERIDDVVVHEQVVLRRE